MEAEQAAQEVEQTGTPAKAKEPTRKPSDRAPYFKNPATINTAHITFSKKQGGEKSSVPGNVSIYPIAIKDPNDVPAPMPDYVLGAPAAPPPKPKSTRLAIKPITVLHTTQGISAASQNKAFVAHSKENKVIFDEMATGLRKAGKNGVPEDAKFQLLVFLDMDDPNDVALNKMSDDLLDGFRRYAWSESIQITAEPSGIVRTSKLSGKRYIVCDLSVMSTTKEGQRKLPTPFFSETESSINWSNLAVMSFPCEVELNISHVTVVGTKSCSFKVYLSSCKVMETPKTAVSESRQALEAAADKMKQSALQARGGAPIADLPVFAKSKKGKGGSDDDIDPDAMDDTMEILRQKAIEAAGRALAASKPKTKKALPPPESSGDDEPPPPPKEKKKASKAAKPPPRAATPTEDESGGEAEQPAKTKKIPDGIGRKIGTKPLDSK